MLTCDLRCVAVPHKTRCARVSLPFPAQARRSARCVRARRDDDNDEKKAKTSAKSRGAASSERRLRSANWNLRTCSAPRNCGCEARLSSRLMLALRHRHSVVVVLDTMCGKVLVIKVFLLRVFADVLLATIFELFSFRFCFFVFLCTPTCHALLIAKPVLCERNVRLCTPDKFS